ncbi:MAG: hypothetical protein ACK6DC_17045, partial [Planctomycetota bacterium]
MKKKVRIVEENPLIGIWWDDGKTIAEFSHPYTVNSSQIAGRVDSNHAHADLWIEAALKMKIDPMREYYLV